MYFPFGPEAVVFQSDTKLRRLQAGQRRALRHFFRLQQPLAEKTLVYFHRVHRRVMLFVQFEQFPFAKVALLRRFVESLPEKQVCETNDGRYASGESTNGESVTPASA